MRRLIVIIVALAAVLLVAAPPRMNAQRMSGRFAAGGGHGSRFGADSNFAGFGYGFGARYGSAYGSLAALPFLSDSLYSDSAYSQALYDAGYPVAAPLPVTVLQRSAQGAPARTAALAEATAPTQPLMIELQGDRYVRVSGDDRCGAEMIDRTAVISRGQTNIAASRTVRELPPAVLVFRDGHREEVSGYTIADGVLYASGDFYTGGAWAKKIELASLNLPETLKASQERGVPFQLPNAPNVVVVFP